MNNSEPSLFSHQSSNLITSTIKKLRQLIEIDVQSGWRCWAGDLAVNQAIEANSWQRWESIPLNNKGHIAWASGRQVLWLGQQFVIPDNLQGYPLTGLSLRLGLLWWAEAAQIFVNGQLVQEGDLFDCSTRILLNSSVTPGEVITVALRLESPHHDNGALMKSFCVYELLDENRLDPGFFADELAVIQKFIETFTPEQIDSFAATVAQIDWSLVSDGLAFERSLSTIRQTLQSQIRHPESKIYLLGHAHLDMAWLWEISETWEAAQRTFSSALNLQKDFPNLIFCHSTPALYEWIEQHRPDLFAAIQAQVKSRRWEIVGGMWVEPELNLIAGESIVRQILYGQRYVKEKFGEFNKVAWVPDTFGFCATLPQILKQGGIEYFVTQKLRWNDTTKFPYGAFWWESPDGTQIFTLMSALIGEGIEPIKMASYVCEWTTQTNLKDALWLPGVGDHGGGPTRDMLEIAQRWERSPFFPSLEFTTALDYLEQIKQSSSVDFPVWNDELYLEFHRGCYTTHADQKRWNRRCEGWLYQAELWAALATISAGLTYPQADLEGAWKKTLLNQFHDILPGTSIPPVFVEANQAWQEVAQVCQEITENSWEAIASHVFIPSPPQPDALPVFVFNSLNWQRAEVVTLNLPTLGQAWTVYDSEGQQLPIQQNSPETLLFVAKNVPAIGYSVFWLCPQPAEKLDSSLKNLKSVQEGDDITYSSSFYHTLANKDSYSQKDWVLENQLLRVTVDSQTGNLSSIFDKKNQQEILNQQPGNQLQAFTDQKKYWDAWNIDPNYDQHPLPSSELRSIEWVENGRLQQRLRVVRYIGKSEFCQDYILSTDSAVLKIHTLVNWQERHVLVKAAFPVSWEADYATYEIPCGAIKRPTRSSEPHQKAKWEVPALRWADLSTDNYGVSLLSDCKYGYDCQANQLRLTLLRSSIWPDPEADQGQHEFTYAVYPHSGSWQSAGTVQRGYELNLPLQAMILPSVDYQRNSSLPACASLIDLQSENLILMAFKQSEDHLNQWILRFYECHGEEAELNWQSEIGLAIADHVDILERTIAQPTSKIAPWKILSLVLKSS